MPTCLARCCSCWTSTCRCSTGPRCWRQIKSDAATAAVPVIMLTTTDDPREIERCYALGCSVYVIKPVDYEALAQAVQRLGSFLQVIRVPGPEASGEKLAVNRSAGLCYELNGKPMISSESNRKATVQRKSIAFALGEQVYALPLEAVREILPMAQLSRPPGMPSLLDGFLNLGGTSVAVVNLGRLFGSPNPPWQLHSPLLVLRSQQAPWCWPSSGWSASFRSPRIRSPGWETIARATTARKAWR